MHSSIRMLAVVAGAAVCATLACSGDDGGVAPPPTPDAASYHWMNPVSGGATLNDVWGPAENNLFATGSGGIVLRYNGNAWRHTQAPTTENLNAIWGADATHVFAVGPAGTILFFNGSSWVKQTSPTTATLHDVWGTSATDVYAVGAQREVIHFDGTSWEAEPVDVGIETFRSIWGSGPDDIYVVGLGRNLLHYDGDAWGVDSTNATFALNAVWGVDSLDVFVVGGNGAAARYDGTWSNIDIGETVFPQSVWGTSSTDVYAMGFAAGAASSAYRWDGMSWSPVEMNSIKGVSSVAGAGDIVVAVGTGGLIHERQSTLEFEPMRGGLTVDLDAVWVSPGGNEAFAAGENGTILHFKNGAWASMTSGTTSRLRGLGAACACDVLAVGENGVVLRYTGADWVDVSPGAAVHFNEAWVDPASGTAFVVGDGATVLRYANGDWEPLSLGSLTHNLQSVWGSSLENVYVVGDELTALQWNGTQFKNVVIDPPNTQNFRSVFGTGPDDVYVASTIVSPPAAAHGGGKIHHWDGDQWTPVHTDPISEVLSVWRDGSAGFATGDSNSLWRDAGDAVWARVWDVENLPYYVNSVHGSSPNNVFIVGNDGAIIRYSP